jgi:hypothetical protein
MDTMCSFGKLGGKDRGPPLSEERTRTLTYDLEPCTRFHPSSSLHLRLSKTLTVPGDPTIRTSVVARSQIAA